MDTGEGNGGLCSQHDGRYIGHWMDSWISYLLWVGFVGGSWKRWNRVGKMGMKILEEG